MLYVFISWAFLITYAAVLFTGKPARAAKSKDRINADHGAMFVRVFYMLALSSVGVLYVISSLPDSGKYMDYSESAVTISSAALFFVALSSLGQRHLALRFGIEPVFEMNELIFMLCLPPLQYAVFALTGNVLLYFLGPAIYSVFLIWKRRKNRVNYSH